MSLVDFLGVENKNLKELSLAFPESKIISRGNEIRIRGEGNEIIKISDILTGLIEHYNRFGKITEDKFKSMIQFDQISSEVEGQEDVIIYSAKGFPVKGRVFVLGFFSPRFSNMFLTSARSSFLAPLKVSI